MAKKSKKQQPISLHEAVIQPCVRVRVESSSYPYSSVGSGQVIHSAPNHEGECCTYVLSCFHTIASSIRLIRDWDSQQNKFTWVKKPAFVTVDNFAYCDGQMDGLGESFEAEVIEWDKLLDLSLLKVRSNRIFASRCVPVTAKTLKKAQPFDQVIAVGCMGGLPPSHTRGEIVSLDQQITVDGMSRKVWRINAPISPGASGGACYLADSGQMIGMVLYHWWGMDFTNFVLPVNTICNEFLSRPAIQELLVQDGKK